MTKSQYRIVQVHDSLHADQTDDGKDFDDDYSANINGDTVTITTANDSDDPHFPQKSSPDKLTMQTPTTIITLIFIYFTLSIGLTFYQRSLLKVTQITTTIMHTALL